MVEVLEMGGIPLVKKVMAPVVNPAVNIVPKPRGISVFGWILIILLIIGALIFIVQLIDHKPLIYEKVGEENI